MWARLAKTAMLIGVLCLGTPAFAQHDPGVRGGILNTAGMLEYRGIASRIRR
jgi:hypothetical protein